MFVQDESVAHECFELGQVASKHVADAVLAHHAAGTLGQGELVLNVHDLADVVQDFEAVDELAALLREVKSGDDICQELVFDPEIALEVLVEELEKLLLQLLCGATFGE